MKQFDLDAILDRTRADRTDRLAVLFDGPRLVPAPPENLLIAPGPDGPVIAEQYGTRFVVVMPLAAIPEGVFRRWLLTAVPHRDPAVDEDGGGE